MGDISVPHSLNNANATISLAESLARLLDPSERKKIADDVRAHNALNETEAKAAKEARELIKKNADILDDTRKLEGRIAKEKKDFDQDKIDFNSGCESEKQKIAILKSEAEAQQEKAKKLLDQVESREKALGEDKKKLSDGVEKLKNDNEKLTVDRKKVNDDLKKAEEIKNAALKLQNDMQTKLEEARKFNL